MYNFLAIILFFFSVLHLLMPLGQESLEKHAFNLNGFLS